MKRLTALMLLAILTSMTATGCLSRAIKEGASVATGPKGFYVEKTSMGPEGAKPLAGYTSFEVGAISDGFGGNAPQQLLDLIPTETRNRLREEGFVVGAGGNTVLITGKVIYFERAGVSGQLFGPFEEAVTEIQLIDKASGKVLGVANVVGRSTTTARQGVDEKAVGVAKGIVKWIQDRYPELPKE